MAEFGRKPPEGNDNREHPEPTPPPGEGVNLRRPSANNISPDAYWDPPFLEFGRVASYASGNELPHEPPDQQGATNEKPVADSGVSPDEGEQPSAVVGSGGGDDGDPPMGEAAMPSDDGEEHLGKMVNDALREPSAASFAEDLELERRADAIGADFPTRDKPIKSDDLNELPDLLGPVLEGITQMRVLETVADGYVVGAGNPSDLPPGSNKPAADKVPVERTPVSKARQIAEDPLLARIDDTLRNLDRERSGHMPDLEERARSHRRSWDLIREATHEIIQDYGVDPSTIKYIPAPPGNFFTYGEKTVYLSTSTGVTSVTAWDGALSPEDRGRVWDEHNRLTKQGAPIMQLHHYVAKGEIPPYLKDFEARIKAESGDIQAAYDEHVQQVKAFCARYGFQDFQVHAPGLRLAIPTALHILEQPFDRADSIVGYVSPTRGFLRTDSPGTFSHARKSEIAWTIGEDGIVRLA